MHYWTTTIAKLLLYLVNKTEISASKKRCSGWDRSRVRGYFLKKSKSSRNTRRKYA